MSADSKPQLKVANPDASVDVSQEASIADLSSPVALALGISNLKADWSGTVDTDNRPNESQANDIARDILGTIMFGGLLKDARGHEQASVAALERPFGDKTTLTLSSPEALEQRAFEHVAGRATVLIRLKLAKAGLEAPVRRAA